MVTSSSLANASSVQLEFNFDKDMDKAVDEVKEALSDLSLPDGAEDPDVSRLSMNAIPVMALSISDEGQTLEELTKNVDENVVPGLEGIEGVSDVQVTGQQMKQVNLELDEDKLNEYGLTQDTIEQVIQGSDITYPLGLTTFDKEVKNLVIDGNIKSLRH